jgi:hypothetical protein
MAAHEGFAVAVQEYVEEALSVEHSVKQVHAEGVEI